MLALSVCTPLDHTSASPAARPLAAVEAFFYVDASGAAYAALVRRAFLAAYPHVGDAPPVVQLDPHAVEAPFAPGGDEGGADA